MSTHALLRGEMEFRRVPHVDQLTSPSFAPEFTRVASLLEQAANGAGMDIDPQDQTHVLYNALIEIVTRTLPPNEQRRYTEAFLAAKEALDAGEDVPQWVERMIAELGVNLKTKKRFARGIEFGVTEIGERVQMERDRERQQQERAEQQVEQQRVDAEFALEIPGVVDEFRIAFENDRFDARAFESNKDMLYSKKFLGELSLALPITYRNTKEVLRQQANADMISTRIVDLLTRSFEQDKRSIARDERTREARAREAGVAEQMEELRKEIRGQQRETYEDSFHGRAHMEQTFEYVIDQIQKENITALTENIVAITTNIQEVARWLAESGEAQKFSADINDVFATQEKVKRVIDAAPSRLRQSDTLRAIRMRIDRAQQILIHALHNK